MDEHDHVRAVRAADVRVGPELILLIRAQPRSRVASEDEVIADILDARAEVGRPDAAGRRWSVRDDPDAALRLVVPTYAYAETAATTSARLAVTPTNALTSVGCARGLRDRSGSVAITASLPVPRRGSSRDAWHSCGGPSASVDELRRLG